jgi:hypothetical protein
MRRLAINMLFSLRAADRSLVCCYWTRCNDRVEVTFWLSIDASLKRLAEVGVPRKKVSTL